jgi:prepilin-type N-terminal cleavage/methylation domain-containing protein
MKPISDFRFPISDGPIQSFFPTLGKNRTGDSKGWKSNQQSAIDNRQSRMGLTLIEVMLAIVILGIGAGVLLVATSQCMSVATKARHYSRAHSLIFRVKAENPLSRGEVEDGLESGEFEDGYTWEREITESETEGREGLYTVRTRVSWSMSGTTSFEEVTEYHYVRPSDEDLKDRRGY